MSLRSDGRVGIGKTDAAYALDVVGDISYSGTLRNGTTDILAGKENTIALGATQYALINTTGGKVGVSTVTNTQLSYLSGVTSGIQAQLNAKISSQWTTSGNDIYNNNTANVGIGSLTPSQKLEILGNVLVKGKTVVNNSVDGTGARGIVLWDVANTDWSIYMGTSGASKSYSGGTACTGVAGINSHSIRIRTANGATNGLIYENSIEACLFSVRASDGMGYIAGNLGIGTTTPNKKLQVVPHTQGAISISGSGDTRYHCYNGGGVQEWVWGQKSSTSHNWILSTLNSGVETDRLTVDTTGNVGIGTITPSFKLHVVGDINCTGNFKVNGTNISTGGSSQWSSSGIDINYTTGRVAIATTAVNGSLNIGGSSGTLRLTLTGEEFYQAGNTSTEGVAFICGVNRTGNRQLWIGDTANMAKNTTNNIIRITPQNGGFGTIDSIATDGITRQTLNLGGTITILGTNGNVGVGSATPTQRLDVSGNAIVRGKIIANDGKDGTNDRGIMLWDPADNNWAIYMGQSGAGRSFNNTNACTGAGGFSAHAIRIRTANSSSQGIIYENSSDACLFSVRANDGLGYIAGSLGIGTTTAGYKLDVRGNTRILETTGTTAQANTGTLVLEHANSGGASSIVFRSAVNAGSDFGYIQYNDNTGSGENAKLRIGTSNDADDDIVLEPSGRVGIKINPSYTLDVAGDINCSGTFRRNGTDLTATFASRYTLTFVYSTYITGWIYNLDISSVRSIFDLGQNIRMFKLIFMSSSDFGDYNTLYGEYTLRISDWAGLKAQVMGTPITQSSVSLSVSSFNQIQIICSLGSGATIRAYITSYI
jgi:hypothetical protein